MQLDYASLANYILRPQYPSSSRGLSTVQELGFCSFVLATFD